jgi:hypothetical protein
MPSRIPRPRSPYPFHACAQAAGPAVLPAPLGESVVDSPLTDSSSSAAAGNSRRYSDVIAGRSPSVSSVEDAAAVERDSAAEQRDHSDSDAGDLASGSDAGYEAPWIPVMKGGKPRVPKKFVRTSSISSSTSVITDNIAPVPSKTELTEQQKKDIKTAAMNMSKEQAEQFD